MTSKKISKAKKIYIDYGSDSYKEGLSDGKEQGRKDKEAYAKQKQIELLEKVLKEVELELGNIYTYAGVDYPAFCGKMVELKDRHCALDRIKERLEQELKKLSGEALSAGKSQKRGSKLKEVDVNESK